MPNDFDELNHWISDVPLPLLQPVFEAFWAQSSFDEHGRSLKEWASATEDPVRGALGKLIGEFTDEVGASLASALAHLRVRVRRNVIIEGTYEEVEAPSSTGVRLDPSDEEEGQ